MDAIRRLTSFALVIFSVACIAAWAAWFNPRAFGAVEAINFVSVDMFPGQDKMFVTLGFAFGSLAVAYLVYPSNRRDDD
jgi:hypothetical protein